MLHDGAAIEFGQEVAEHAGGAGLGLEKIKDAAPRAVAEGLENQVVCVVG